MSWSLTARERLLLWILAGLLGLYAFLTQVDQPIRRRWASARASFEQEELSLRRDRERLEREGDLKAREARLKAREDAIAALVPGRHAAALFVHYLSQAEAEAGVHIRSLRTGDRRPAGDLVELPVEIESEGTFWAHVLFHQSLEKVPLFFSLKQWKLDANREAVRVQAAERIRQGRPWEAEALLRAPPRLRGAYTLTLYFRPQQPGPQPAAQPASGGNPDPFMDNLIAEFRGELHRAYGTPPDPAPPASAPPQAAGAAAPPAAAPGAPPASPPAAPGSAPRPVPPAGIPVPGLPGGPPPGLRTPPGEPGQLG